MCSSDLIRAAIDAVRPGVALSAFVLPQSFWEVGQDLSMFARSLDEVRPMCYWNDWGYDPAWVTDDCLATVDARIVHADAATRVIPVIGAGEAEADTAAVLADLARRRPGMPGLDWFSYTPWPRERMAEVAGRMALLDPAG